MAEEKSQPVELGANITLTGFSKLDSSEMLIVRKIVGVQVKRLKEIAPYKALKVTLKSSSKTGSHSYIHEAKAELELEGNVLGASSQDRNVFTAVSGALKKIISETEHRYHKEEWKQARHKQARKSKT